MKIIAITPNYKQDYLVETIIEGLKKLNCHIIATDLGNGIDRAYDDDDVRHEAKTADLVLAFFGKVRGNNPPKHYLLHHIDRWDITAYIDGSEWTCTANPYFGQVEKSRLDPSYRRGEPWNNNHMLKNCRWYFKRECYPQDVELGIVPLPFAIVDRMVHHGDAQRVNDVFCSLGQDITGLRKEAKQASIELVNEGFNVFNQSGMQYGDYKKQLASSKIAIDAWGGGDCCARLWEIVGNRVCPAYQKYNIVIPHPFTDMENAIEYSSKEELKSKVQIALFDEKLLTHMTDECYEHAVKYHTSHARAQYMLDIISKGL